MKKRILSALAASTVVFSICGTSATAAETSTATGDLNGDGKFTVADVVAMENWLLGKKIENIDISAADFCKDGRLDVFDMILMKKKLIDNETAVNPLQPPVQPILCSDMEDAADKINNYNPEDYPESDREAYNKMIEEFKKCGGIYEVSGVGVVPVGETHISLLPGSKYEDSGIGYNLSYKDNFFRVEYHKFDENYKGSMYDMAEYMNYRFNWKPESEIEANGLLYSVKGIEGGNFALNAFTKRLSYDYFDTSEYYCIVKTNASEKELAEFLTIINNRSCYSLRDGAIISDIYTETFDSFEEYEELYGMSFFDICPCDGEYLNKLGEFEILVIRNSIDYFFVDDSAECFELSMTTREIGITSTYGKKLTAEQVDFSDMRTADILGVKSYYYTDNGVYYLYDNGDLYDIKWYDGDIVYSILGYSIKLSDYPEIEGTYISELLDIEE